MKVAVRAEAPQTHELARGWPLLAVCTLGVGLGLAPLPFYTVGVFAPQLMRAFGWRLGDVLVGFAVMTFTLAAVGPLVGRLTDRLGVRRVAAASSALFGLAFMALGLTTHSLLLFYLNWAAIAVLGAGSLPITWTRAISAAFDARRGLALGIVMAGTGAFGFVVKPLASALIAGVGWRYAFALLGFLPLLVAAPAAWWGLRDNVDSLSLTASPERAGSTLPQALRQWRLYALAACVLPISLAVSGPIPNMETILRSLHVAPQAIVGLASLIGLAVVAGRFAGGWILDRTWAPAAACVLLTPPALGLWLLAQPGVGSAAQVAAVLLVGLAAGAEHDIFAYLVSRYFGLRSYGAIYGLIYGVFAVGAGLGPILFGRAFDATGSYTQPLLASAAVLPLAAAGLLTLGRYPLLRRSGAANA